MEANIYPKLYFGARWIGRLGTVLGIFFTIIAIILAFNNKVSASIKLLVPAGIIYFSTSMYRKPRFILDTKEVAFQLGDIAKPCTIVLEEIESAELQKRAVLVKTKSGQTIALGGAISKKTLAEFYNDLKTALGSA